MAARNGSGSKRPRAEHLREKAFLRARRHTRVVKALRMVLPAASLLMLASYGVSFETEIKFKDGTLSLDAVKYSSDVLTAENPKYEGFDKDGGRFFVTAKVAEQDIKQTKPVKLLTISGKMTEQAGTVTDLTAHHGFYDLKNKTLDMHQQIVVISTNGLRADLTEAQVHTEKRTITSSKPVLVTMPSGTVHGNRMQMDQKQRLVTFHDGVRTHLKPADETRSANQPRQDTDTERQQFGDSSKPTDITSTKLVIDDNAKLATFSGNVRAVQADSVLEAPEMVVRYVNDQSGQPPGAAPVDAAGSGRVESIVARTNVTIRQNTGTVTAQTADFRPIDRKAQLMGSVVIVSSDQSRVTADQADLDTQADTAVLTGQVIVTQERNELRGRRLLVDRKAGTTLLTSPGEGNSKPAPISARLYQSAKPSDKPAGAARPEKQKEAGNPIAGGATFQTDPNAPIDILATRFESDDRTSKAIFTGNVQAQQGNVHMKSTRLIANYTGGSLAGASAAAPRAERSGAAARVTAIRAEENVHITSGPDQQATGDWADFDIPKNTVTLGGKVTLIRGKQIIRGPKLVIDLTTGVSRMDTGSRQPGPFLDNSAQFAPGPGQLPDPAKKPVMPKLTSEPTANTECPPGRMCMLLYQDDPTNKKPATDKPQSRGSSGWSTVKSPRQQP